ncbi:MAG TPA: hypothetical protein VLG37_02820 [Candidatus Saccharimonadales bacterium]|nr:hypothetical protein [Candidatus Saccharimonadales bacterium]
MSDIAALGRETTGNKTIKLLEIGAAVVAVATAVHFGMRRDTPHVSVAPKIECTPSPDTAPPFALSAQHAGPSEVVSEVPIDPAELSRLNDMAGQVGRFVSATSVTIFKPPLGGYEERATFSFDKTGNLTQASPTLTSPRFSNEAEVLAFEGLMRKSYWENVATKRNSKASRAFMEAFGRLSCGGTLDLKWAGIVGLGAYTNIRMDQDIGCSAEGIYAAVLTEARYFPSALKANIRQQSNRRLFDNLVSSAAATLMTDTGANQAALASLLPGLSEFQP